jgi:hypothetical protein
MAASDPYFRFPLCALTYGESPADMLTTLVHWGIVEVGRAMMNSPEVDREKIRDESEFPDPPEGYEPGTPVVDYDSYPHMYDLVCIGLHVTQAHVWLNWELIREDYRKMEAHVKARMPSPLVTMKADWLYDARDTAMHEEGFKPITDEPGWIKWREFRVLAALFSVIGRKPFAWVSTATLLHRVCGYGTAAKLKEGKPPAFCSPLSRWAVEATLGRLEELRFFIRARVSRSPTGRGGRTAYSLRHAKREQLFEELRKSTFIKKADYRREDLKIWTEKKNQESARLKQPTPTAAPPVCEDDSPF